MSTIPYADTEAAKGWELRGIADARAQLWARVYAAEYAAVRSQPHYSASGAHHDAEREADTAARRFDERCGGAR